MTTRRISLSFGHHALAVLGAAIFGSTIFSLLWTTILAIAANERMPGITWLVTLAALFWVAVFIVALPSAGLVFSMFWRVTRRKTVAANWICLLAGATTGIVMAPLASSKFQGTTLLQLLAFTLMGAGVAAIYLVILHRVERRTRVSVPPSIFS